MRGAHHTFHDAELEERIIPADAGSTARVMIRSYATKDHPRGCGEHTVIVMMDGVIAGSSPRMRGALVITVCFWISAGIIPADAGSTVRRPGVGDDIEDHPRGCGEHPALAVRDVGD